MKIYGTNETFALDTMPEGFLHITDHEAGPGHGMKNKKYHPGAAERLYQKAVALMDYMQSYKQREVLWAPYKEIYGEERFARLGTVVGHGKWFVVIIFPDSPIKYSYHLQEIYSLERHAFYMDSVKDTPSFKRRRKKKAQEE